MKAATYEKHLEQVAAELNLNPHSCTGLSTAADMENAVIEEQSFSLADSSILKVTAVVTGGIDKNGARVGDPACWQEIGGNYYPVTPGTINIFLHIDAQLPPGALARSLVTCTEAKTAAVGELLCPSLYSSGIATGSGTDGIIVISNPNSTIRLTAAGKDSKLGEMIGTAVKKATKEAIGRQTGVTPAYQHHVIQRLSRFSLTEKFLYETYLELYGQIAVTDDSTSDCLDQDEFLKKTEALLNSGFWVGKASFLAHLLDQIQWGMLSETESKELLVLLFPDSVEITDQLNWNTNTLIKLFCKNLILASSVLP